MKKIFVLLPIIVLFVCVNAANAVNCNIYQKAIDWSSIKAIAVVKNVEVTDSELGTQTKKVLFETVKGFTEDTPKQFEGYCYSFKTFWPWARPFIEEKGGAVYYLPKKNEKVFVAVSRNHDFIVSYVRIDKALELELMNNGLANLLISPLELQDKND